jgi:AcrR family transcriptional regulator
MPAVQAPQLAAAHAHVAEIQRTRLLSAAVGVIEEFGYAETTVGRITTRARVSRRTFYELFANCEECLVAVMEGALGRIGDELAEAASQELPWQQRVRNGLWAILSFCDREPALARVCVVESLRGSETVLRRRAEVLSQLVSVIDEGRHERMRGAEAPPLTAEGLVGAAHAIVYERLLKRSGEPLTGLCGQLMGMIVLPYLGAAVARREQARSTPSPPQLPVSRAAHETSHPGGDPLKGVSMRLTYRTALVLDCIARNPGISNRKVGDRAGISDQGQTSKLLARLDRLGLVVNEGEGHAKGEANAWRLTSTGSQVAQSISTYSPGHMEAA